MNTSLIITLLATDRPGLVSELSELLHRYHANWMASRFVRLSGKFAGLLQVSVAADQVTGLTHALQDLQSDDLNIQIESDVLSTDITQKNLLRMEIVGQDRPGIIEDVSHELASLGVNIEEMTSDQRLASMSNEILFYATIVVTAPVNISPDDVRSALEAMSDSFMIDFKFSGE